MCYWKIFTIRSQINLVESSHLGSNTQLNCMLSELFTAWRSPLYMGQREDFPTRVLKLLMRKETAVLKKMETLLGVNLARDTEQLSWTRSR